MNIFLAFTTEHNAVNHVIVALFNALFPFIFIPYGKIKNFMKLYTSLHDSQFLSKPHFRLLEQDIRIWKPYNQGGY
jgi:hypothetical protein